MYQPTNYHVPAQEICHLLTEALARIPEQCNGSFIVYFPFVPDCLADVPIIGTVRLIGLLPSQQIVLHADAPIPGVRHHVPLQINEGCWCFSGGVWRQLELGRVYTMDPSQPHGAVNWGTTLRLHLMIDVET